MPISEASKFSGPDRATLVDASYAETMLAEIRALRRRVIQAWQERGVGLTLDERAALQDEIIDTCSLLTDLTKIS